METRTRAQNICAGLVLALTAGGPASADDFCVNLGTALASARTGFTGILGPPNHAILGWRNAKLSLPGSEGCKVEIDTLDRSYVCAWKKEQPAALNARYKYMVQQTDQCLAGSFFEKASGDRITAWRDPAGGTVIVNGRLVVLMLEVRR